LYYFTLIEDAFHPTDLCVFCTYPKAIKYQCYADE
jgi:hypothetical protein